MEMKAIDMRTVEGGRRRSRAVEVGTLLVFALGASAHLAAQDTAAVRSLNDSVTVRFVATDIRAAIQALSRYLSKPVLVGNIPATLVTLETPAPIPRAGVRGLLKGVVESQNLQFTDDSTFFRIGPVSTDQPRQQLSVRGDLQLYVIHLKHARATDVAGTVNILFGGGGEFSGSHGLSTGTLSDELRRNVVPSAVAQPATASPSSSIRLSALSAPVTIVPDQLTNSLLLRASTQDFDVLKQAVDELDIRPLQVLIEVLIVEARRNRSFSFGADLLLPPQRADRGNGTAAASTLGGGLGDLVIRLMSLGHADIEATLRLAQSKGVVQIMSRPVLLASNNTEARILVGEQRPFVQVSRSLATDTPSRDQVVQYRDVGTKLTVRPTINQDGYVSLVIQQEVNQATNETAFDAPVISTRETATQVLVRDGQTIVLGGLRDRQRDAAQSGVPILSRIPILGGLFGSASRSSNETELYLFLTPRILRTDADADSVTAPRLPSGLVP